MSLSEASQSGSVTSVDSKTGVEFPNVIDGTRRRLVGIGVRKKTLFGLKNIDVYAFGMCAFFSLVFAWVFFVFSLLKIESFVVLNLLIDCLRLVSEVFMPIVMMCGN